MHTSTLQKTIWYPLRLSLHVLTSCTLSSSSCCCGSFQCFWFRGRGCSCTTKKPFKCYNVLKLVVRLSTIDPTKVGPPAASHCDTSIQTSDSGVQATSPKFPPFSTSWYLHTESSSQCNIEAIPARRDVKSVIQHRSNSCKLKISEFWTLDSPSSWKPGRF